MEKNTVRIDELLCICTLQCNVRVISRLGANYASITVHLRDKYKLEQFGLMRLRTIKKKCHHFPKTLILKRKKKARKTCIDFQIRRVLDLLMTHLRTP